MLLIYCAIYLGNTNIHSDKLDCSFHWASCYLASMYARQYIDTLTHVLLGNVLATLSLNRSRLVLLQNVLESSSEDASLRSLQQVSGPPTRLATGGNSSTTAAAAATKVATPKELLLAVGKGVKDIRITDHMDLSGSPGYGFLDQGIIASWKLRSIRVRNGPL